MNRVKGYIVLGSLLLALSAERGFASPDKAMQQLLFMSGLSNNCHGPWPVTNPVRLQCQYGPLAVGCDLTLQMTKREYVVTYHKVYHLGDELHFARPNQSVRWPIQDGLKGGDHFIKLRSKIFGKCREIALSSIN
jgi:hypothetical protein